MTEIRELTPEEAAEEAAHKAKSAAMAIEVSRELHQKELVGQTREALMEALEEVFGKKDSSDDMNIQVRRIPLICNDIIQIHKDIKETKSNISDINDNIKWGVRTLIGAVLVGIVGVLFVLIK